MAKPKEHRTFSRAFLRYFLQELTLLHNNNNNKLQLQEQHETTETTLVYTLLYRAVYIYLYIYIIFTSLYILHSFKGIDMYYYEETGGRNQKRGRKKGIVRLRERRVRKMRSGEGVLV